MTHGIDSRIQYNKHIAGDLRRRLEQRHAEGTRVREMIDWISDDEELVSLYLRNEQQGREHAAKQRAEKEGIA